MFRTRFRLRKGGDGRVHQVCHPTAVGRGDRKEGVEPKTKEINRGRLLLIPIDLVDGEEHWLAAAAQQIHRLGVSRIHAFPAVKEKNDEVGLGDSKPGLLLHTPDDSFRFAQIDTAGINKHKGGIAPHCRGEVAVTGHAWCGVHHGFALATQPVEQGRFAGIGPAHNRDYR